MNLTTQHDAGLPGCAPMKRTLKPNGSRKDKGLEQRSVTQEEVDRQQLYRLINEGARLLSQRKAKEAAVVLERAYRLDPDNVDVKVNLGGAYILLGRFQEAVPLLEEAARQAPDNEMVWTNLAAAYLGPLEEASPEQEEAAIAAFKRALQANPKAPHVDYNLGLIYLKRGDLVAALTHFRRAREVNPVDRDAEYYIRKIQARLAGRSSTGDESSANTDEEPSQP